MKMRLLASLSCLFLVSRAEITFDVNGNLIDDGLSLSNNQRRAPDALAVKGTRDSEEGFIGNPRLPSSVREEGLTNPVSAKDKIVQDEIDEVLKQQQAERQRPSQFDTIMEQIEQKPQRKMFRSGQLPPESPESPESPELPDELISVSNHDDLQADIAQGSKIDISDPSLHKHSLEVSNGEPELTEQVIKPLGEESPEATDEVVKRLLKNKEEVMQPEEQNALNNLTEESTTSKVREDEEDTVEEELKLDLYPWETTQCKDHDPEACQAFKPLCSILKMQAHQSCQKTCKLCATDRPTPHGN